MSINDKIQSRVEYTDELLLRALHRGHTKFTDIFNDVWADLKKRHHSGEEIARLRCYERLNMLVRRGDIEKLGREYQLLPKKEGGVK